jgi:hypothetical protein
MKRAQTPLRGSLRLAAGALLVVVVLAAALWGALALWLALPAAAGVRLAVAVLFACPRDRRSDYRGTPPPKRLAAAALHDRAHGAAADYTERWYDRTVDLPRLDSLDLIGTDSPAPPGAGSWCAPG